MDDPTNWIGRVNKISRPVKDAGRSYRGFNLFSPDDEAVFHAIAQGVVQGFGIRNSHLRVLLGKTTGQVSRILKRLRNHSLIKKAANTYKYYLTSLGRQVVTTLLELKELFVIPNFRGRTMVRGDNRQQRKYHHCVYDLFPRTWNEPRLRWGYQSSQCTLNSCRFVLGRIGS